MRTEVKVSPYFNPLWTLSGIPIITSFFCFLLKVGYYLVSLYQLHSIHTYDVFQNSNLLQG